MYQLKDFLSLRQMLPFPILAFVGLLALFFAVFLVSHFSGSSSPGRKRKNVVLFLGSCQAGKTTLYSLLRFGRTFETTTSMKPNSFRYPVSDPKPRLEIVDVPGHPRLRSQFTDFLPVTQRIFFILDATSSSWMAHFRDVSEYLYDILAHPQCRSNQIPVTIVCHKQDQILAFNASRVRQLLEQELDKLRETKSKSVLEQGQEEEVLDNYLGFDGKPFQFDDVENEIEVIETSVEDFRAISERLME
jgi:signal recognition particle receptor subunit beta